MRLGKSMRERFEEKFEIDEATGCWNWTAAKNGRGYGHFYTPPSFSNHKMDFSHRVSYYLYKCEKVAEDLCIRHKCDNTSCVNPNHLEKGSHTDNMQDMVKRGRHKSGTQKLTKQQIQEMKLLRKQGVMVKDIADKYEIDRGHASRVTRSEG